MTYQNPGRMQEVPGLEIKGKQAKSEQESQRTVLRCSHPAHQWDAHANWSSKHLPLLKEENSICSSSCLKHDFDLSEKG